MFLICCGIFKLILCFCVSAFTHLAVMTLTQVISSTCYDVYGSTANSGAPFLSLAHSYGESCHAFIAMASACFVYVINHSR